MRMLGPRDVNAIWPWKGALYTCEAAGHVLLRLLARPPQGLSAWYFVYKAVDNTLHMSRE